MYVYNPVLFPTIVDKIIPLNEELLIIIVHVAKVLDPQLFQLLLNLADIVLRVFLKVIGIHAFENVGGVEINLFVLGRRGLG